MKKVVSPCFCVHHDTEHKLVQMKNRFGFSKSVLVEIAIGLLNEQELHEAVISRSSRDGIGRKREAGNKDEELF